MSSLYQNKYRVKSPRLKRWNYRSHGAYFITICTKDRVSCLGEIRDGKVCVSDQGSIVYRCWYDLPRHYSNCVLDEFIVIPNHIHGVIFITLPVETGFKPVSTNEKKVYSLSEMVRALKNILRPSDQRNAGYPRTTFLADKVL